jgi:hypothetical protein
VFLARGQMTNVSVWQRALSHCGFIGFTHPPLIAAPRVPLAVRWLFTNTVVAGLSDPK